MKLLKLGETWLSGFFDIYLYLLCQLMVLMHQRTIGSSCLSALFVMTADVLVHKGLLTGPD